MPITQHSARSATRPGRALARDLLRATWPRVAARHRREPAKASRCLASVAEGRRQWQRGLLRGGLRRAQPVTRRCCCSDCARALPAAPSASALRRARTSDDLTARHAGAAARRRQPALEDSGDAQHGARSRSRRSRRASTCWTAALARRQGLASRYRCALRRQRPTLLLILVLALLTPALAARRRLGARPPG